MDRVRTLVVDDDEDTRDTLRFMLEDSGYTVVEAVNGSQALKMLHASDVPLVTLLDLDMPQLDGIAVLETVAQDAHLKACHAFILLTAVSRNHYRGVEQICADLSAPLIPKPFDVDMLLDLVATAARRVSSVVRD